MRVVNVCGFPFSVKYNEHVVVVPFDNQAYDVPDDLGMYNELRVIIPPKPVEKAPVQEVVEVTDKDLSEAKINRKINKPLKGVKIKKKKRQELLGILKKKYNRKKIKE